MMNVKLRTVRSSAWILSILGLFPPFAGWTAGDSPQSIVMQGLLTASDGVTPLTDSNVTIALGVYDPSGNCLLYQESQSGIDLSQSAGLFSIQVGSATGSAKRVVGVDPGLTMSQVFANGGSAIRAIGTSNCLLGYTPSSGDARTLRITVSAASLGGSVVLSPDQFLGSVPQAVVAQTLQGLDPSAFLQASGNLSQATALALVGGADASALHHHDSLYMKLGSGGSQNLGSGQFYTAGSLAVGSSSSAVGTTMQVTAASSATKGLLVKASTGQTANLLEIANSSSTPIFTVNSSGAVTTGAWNGSAIGVSYGGTGLTSGTQGGLPYFSGATSMASTGAGASGQVLVSGGTGAPAWSSNLYSNGTNVGIGTSSPSLLLDLRADTSTYGGNPLLQLYNTTTTGDGRATIRFQSDRISVQRYDVGIDSSGGASKNWEIRDITSAGAPVRFALRTNGNVGIGTSTASTLLERFGPGVSAGGLTNYQLNVNDSAASATGVGGGIAFSGNDGTAAKVFGGIAGKKENSTSGDYSGYLGFYTRSNGSNPAEQMRIDSSGNVAIGTTTASAKLTVNGPIVSLQSNGSVTGASPNWASSLAFSSSNAFSLNPSSAVANDTLTLTFTGTPANGGTYMVSLKDAVAMNVVFVAASCASLKYKPASTTTNTISTTGTGGTLITLTTIYNGANFDCYVTWASGYQ